jgi:hypothetical protein
MRADALVGGEGAWVERFARYGANTLRSLMPQVVQHGVATAAEVGIETFERRYREEVLGRGSVVQWFTCVGAWARKGVPAVGSRGRP